MRQTNGRWSRRQFLRWAALGLLMGPSACLAPPGFDEAGWRRRVAATRVRDLYAAHRGDGVFFNPWMAMPFGVGRVLRWQLSKSAVGPQAARWQRAPRVANHGGYLGDGGSPDSLTMVGHATVVLQWSGQVVLTDPHFGPTALLVRRLVDPGIELTSIPDGAIAVLSHNHYDHLDRATVAALGRRVRWLCPLGLKDTLRGMGAGEVVELDWWQRAEIDGTRFTCLPTQHWSLRLLERRNRSLWCSWMMERGGRKVYFGGDSGYFKGFAEFGRRFGEIDLAVLPIGAYEPRWFMHFAHMNVAEALQAMVELRARRMVPMQWGVFKLGDEPAAYPAFELATALRGRPALAERVHLLPVGGRLRLA